MNSEQAGTHAVAWGATKDGPDKGESSLERMKGCEAPGSMHSTGGYLTMTETQQFLQP